MQYTFTENGKDINVPLEKWAWHVLYKDGTELKQYDDAGRFHQFKEIDQSKVAVFEMVSTENPALRHSIDMAQGFDQIFHFYRRSRLNIGTGAETHLCFYCFGAKVGGVSIYHFIMPDNRLVITTNRDIKLLA